ncbi:hypothetical protein VTJ83DRAFT_3667 [Remersonia thermophila]|uniref:Uncharacterized protein n=1 Tax=Remersonia thermophila TaxID=72144 RepID=A0ABR4DG47_9PEZI
MATAMTTTQRCPRTGRLLAARVGARLGAFCLRLAGEPFRSAGGRGGADGQGEDDFAGRNRRRRRTTTTMTTMTTMTTRRACESRAVMDVLFADEPDDMDALAVENEWGSPPQAEPLPRYTRHAADAEGAPPAYAPPPPAGPPPAYEMTVLCDVLDRRPRCPALDEQRRTPRFRRRCPRGRCRIDGIAPRRASGARGSDSGNHTGNAAVTTTATRTPSVIANDNDNDDDDGSSSSSSGSNDSNINNSNNKFYRPAPGSHSFSGYPALAGFQQPSKIIEYRGRQIRVPARLVQSATRGD